MKPFEELTESELLALAADEARIKDYIDLECAEAGVALLPAAPVAPSRTVPPPDMTVFKVLYFEFADRAEAIRVMDAINAAKSRGDMRMIGADYRSPYRWQAASGSVELSETTCYSPDLAAMVADDAVRLAKETDTYNTQKREWEAIEQARRRITQRVWDAIDAARGKESRRQRIRAEYQRYLELSGGLRRVAARFLAAAQKDAEALCPELFEFTRNDPADPKPRKYEGATDDQAIPL